MKITGFRNDSKGMALTVVIMVIIMMTLLGGYATRLSYNQRVLEDSSTGKRIQQYYACQAGIEDAKWRIRTNNTKAPDGTNLVGPPWVPVADFNNPFYFVMWPGYTFNVDGVSVHVIINAYNNAMGTRPVSAEAIET